MNQLDKSDQATMNCKICAQIQEIKDSKLVVKKNKDFIAIRFEETKITETILIYPIIHTIESE